MKRIIFTLLALISALNAVYIGTSKHYSDTLKISNYLSYTTADEMKNKNGNTTIDNFKFSLSKYEFRPILYKGDYVYHMKVPYKDQKSKLLKQNDTGIGDIKVGMGYFIPNSFKNTDTGVLVNIQFPTGKFDKYKTINNGSGHYAASIGFYMHKMANNIVFDGAVNYNYNFKNNDNNIKKGDEIILESSIAYMFTPNLFIGPTLTYSYRNDNELNGIKQYDSSFSKLNAGLDALFIINKTTSVLLGVFQDYNVNNTLETTTVMTRIVFTF